jgi:aerobic-type carbon monoxide dehydrogenase small subunit (CoxS/CutS family)
MNGKTVTSCMVLAPDAQDQVLPPLGLRQDTLRSGRLAHGVSSAASARPGSLCSSRLAAGESQPTEEEVALPWRQLCRCTGHSKVVQAILAAKTMKRKRLNRKHDA